MDWLTGPTTLSGKQCTLLLQVHKVVRGAQQLHVYAAYSIRVTRGLLPPSGGQNSSITALTSLQVEGVREWRVKGYDPCGKDKQPAALHSNENT
jgi:hypothetical protein